MNLRDRFIALTRNPRALVVILAGLLEVLLFVVALVLMVKGLAVGYVLTLAGVVWIFVSMSSWGTKHKIKLLDWIIEGEEYVRK